VSLTTEVALAAPRWPASKGERIRRKPVLDGLVNEYTPPPRAEEPAGHRPDPGVVRKTGYLV
jgi:hypothetical protein